MTSQFSADIIIRQSQIYKQLIGHSHNILDNYFRLISSYSGKILASITNLRQLTIFDLQNQLVVGNFTLENVVHCAFNEDSSILAVTTLTPSLHIYKISTLSSSTTINSTSPSSSNNTTTTNNISLTQLQQIRPLPNTTTYGWIVSTLDNGYFYFTQNQQIFVVNGVTFEIKVASMDVMVKKKCAPYYLIMDRQYKRLVSVSRVGQVCVFGVGMRSWSDIEQQQQQQQRLSSFISYWPQLTLTQSTNLPSINNSTLTVSDINQSDQFILISTSRVTDYNSSYYNTFILSKQNITMVYKIKLEQELLAPPYTIVVDNVENYLLAFLKGERSLYVYDMAGLNVEGQGQVNVVGNNNSSSNAINQTTTTLSYISKLQMPFLMQGISYNTGDEILIMGISSIKNQNKIIYMDIGFNCSNIISQSLLQNQQQQQQQNTSSSLIITSNISELIKPMCTQQCVSMMNNSVFSFSERKCVIKSPNQLNQIQHCKQLGVRYLWDIYGQQCQLQCKMVANSLSQVTFGLPEQCYCQYPYVWDAGGSACVTITTTNNSTTITTNPNNTDINANINNTNNHTTNINDYNTTIHDDDNNNSNGYDDNNNSQPRQISQSNRVGVAVGVTIGMIVMVGLVVVLIYFLLYKRRRLCFKRDKENEIGDGQSAKSSNENYRQEAEKPRSETQSQSPQKQVKVHDPLTVHYDDLNNVDTERKF